MELWDDESWYVLSDRHLQIASNTGLLSDLPVVLTSRTFILVFCGDLAAAGGLVDELRSLHETTGIGNPPFGAVVLGAWRGLANDASQLIESTIRDARARNEGIGVAVSEYARALLCNATGQYEEALLAASRAVQDQRQVAAENWGLPELIESATRVGKTELATDAMNRLAVKAQAAGTDWALGIEARSRALLSGDDAETFFRKAIAHLSHTRVRGELARAHLLYGEWLRRANRRVDARHELRSAYEMFSAMSMEGFAERTREELRAAGATVRARNVETRDDLTAQEAHIARLARDGLSNPEIGAQLFISARTVEWHLGNVFTKLGISSRKELISALHDDRPSAIVANYQAGPALAGTSPISGAHRRIQGHAPGLLRARHAAHGGTLIPVGQSRAGPKEDTMAIGIVGAGNMGASIATQLAKTGEPVTLTDRNLGKAESVVAGIARDGVSAANVSATLASDVVVLALWYPGTTDFAAEHAAELDGKIVIDISNPLDESWVRLATDPSTSSAELLAQQLPGSRIVKAFNTTHAPALADGQVDETALDVLLAGDDDAAKARVGELVTAAGLRPIDAGRLDNARLLERLTAFQIELSQRYELDFRLTFKLLPADLPT